MMMSRNPTNSSTSGGTGILNSVVSRISLTDLVAVGKVSDGGWITVRDRLVLHSTQLAHYVLVVASERILEKVKMCEIRSEIYGASDHCPIVLEIDDTSEATDDVRAADTVSTTGTVGVPGPSTA